MFEQETRKLSPYRPEPETQRVDARKLQRALMGDAQVATTITADAAPLALRASLAGLVQMLAKYGGERGHAVTRRPSAGEAWVRFDAEFCACHVRDAADMSVADIAAARAALLPEEYQHIAAPLADSYWDLYEIVEVRSTGVVVTSRFDQRRAIVTGLDASLEVGSVVLARLVDVGVATFATTSIAPSYRQLGLLVSALADRYDRASWSEFMRGTGARIVVEWVRRIGA